MHRQRTLRTGLDRGSDPVQQVKGPDTAQGILLPGHTLLLVIRKHVSGGKGVFSAGCDQQ